MSIELASGIKAMRPFLPAKDFATSRRFYGDLGFTIEDLGPDIAQMHFGAHMFLLQDFYVEDWAANFMMHVLVEDVAIWWTHIEKLDLGGRYGVQPPRPPKLEPWGLETFYLVDPSGVLWHIASKPAARSA